MDTALHKALGFSPESLPPKLESRVSCLLEDFKNDILTTSDVQEQLELMTQREKISRIF